MCLHKDQRKGFTFLELLTAMAIMSVISASLYASLTIGFRAKRSVDNSISKVRTAHLSMELIKQDIESALPPTGILAGAFIGTDEKNAWGDDADRISFYASSQDYRQFETSCDIRKVEYFIDDSSYGELVLIRSITTNLLASKAAEPFEEIITRSIGSFNVRYLDGTSWVDSWDSAAYMDTLPSAVEITITIRTSENQHGKNSFTRVFHLACSNQIPEASIRVE